MTSKTTENGEWPDHMSARDIEICEQAQADLAEEAATPPDVQELGAEFQRLQGIADAALNHQTQAERDHLAARLRASEMLGNMYRRQLSELQETNAGLLHDLEAAEAADVTSQLADDLEQVKSDHERAEAALNIARMRVADLERQRDHYKDQRLKQLTSVLGILKNLADKWDTNGVPDAAMGVEEARKVLKEIYNGALGEMNDD